MDFRRRGAVEEGRKGKTLDSRDPKEGEKRTAFGLVSAGCHNPSRLGRFSDCPITKYLETPCQPESRNKVMFPQAPSSYVKDLKCHVETTICFWLGLFSR